MKILPTMMSAASGSLAGITASHNRGGMYFRARTVPVNPASENQEQVRAALTAQAVSWSSELSPAEREAWDLYAANVVVTDTLGQSRTLSGINWYIASGVPRLQAESKQPQGMTPGALPVVFAGPTTFDRGEYTTPTHSAAESTGLTVSFSAADAWAQEDGSALLIFQGRPQNPGVRFFKGPWRLILVVPGDAVTPPTTPVLVLPAELTAEGYTISEGQNLWIAAAVTRADGRISTRRIVGPEIVGS